VLTILVVIVNFSVTAVHVFDINSTYKLSIFMDMIAVTYN